MTFDIKKSLKENQAILLMMASDKYNDVSTLVPKQIASKSVCYVTLNKTYTAVEESLKKKKVKTDNIVYIDAISNTIKKTPSQTDRCYFVSSPGALTELALVINKFLAHKFEYLIFDSLTNLMIYQKKAPVAKFLSSIINKIKDSNTKAVFYALKMKEQQELVDECSLFVDKVLTYKK